MKKFFSYFLQGLILFIPTIITGVILLKMFNFFENPFSFEWLSNSPVVNTFIGLFVTLGTITLLGTLASSYVFKQVFSYFEEKLENAPFIRHIYSPVKDFTNAFVGNKKKFNKPVLVLTNPLANIEQIGFMTEEDLIDFDLRDKVAVYLPFSYSLSGQLILIPREQTRPLDKEASEVMKFVVSGGVTHTD
jgi:uncharacterized membrane protein